MLHLGQCAAAVDLPGWRIEDPNQSVCLLTAAL